MNSERGRLNDLRNRAEVAVYRELRPMVRNGVVRVRVTLAGVAVVACVMTSGGYLLGSAGDTDHPAPPWPGDRANVTSDAPGDRSMRGEHLAKAVEYERLAKKYAGNPPASCGTDRPPKDLRLRSMCD